MKKIFFLLITVIALVFLVGCSSTDKLEKLYNDMQENLNYKAKISLILKDKREMHSTIYLASKLAKAEVQTILPDGTVSPLVVSYFEQPLGGHVYQITFDEHSGRWIKRFSGESEMIGTLDSEIFDPKNFSKNANNKYTLKSEYKTYFGFSSLTIEFKSGKVYIEGGTLYDNQAAIMTYVFSDIGKIKITLPEYIEENN